MPAPIYDEDTIEELPFGSEVYSRLQDLRDAVSHMESERDSILYLLMSVIEAYDSGDIEEAIEQAKEALEDNDYFR